MGELVRPKSFNTMPCSSRQPSLVSTVATSRDPKHDHWKTKPEAFYDRKGKNRKKK